MQEILIHKISDAIVSLHRESVLDCMLSSKTLEEVRLIEQTYIMAREFLIAGNERKAARLYVMGMMLSIKFGYVAK